MTPLTRPSVAIVAAGNEILGGQGVQAQSLMEALSQDGYQVSFTPVNPRFPAGLGWARQIPCFRTALNQAFYIPSLASLAQADVVHVFAASYWSFLLGPASALSAAKVAGKPVVLHYHSGEADDHLGNWGPLVHPWLKAADALVVPSDYLSGIFAAHGYRARVIRNVVDLSRFQYRRRYRLGPRLLSTRNFERHYRVDVVLEAFARLREQLPHATLTVVGYGSEEERLRRMAGEGVRFLGKVDPSRMPAVYDSADIFLNASVIDNQPVSILEAFASGLPVVSTETGDIRSMVQHGHTGLIVPPDDPVALARAAIHLLDVPRHALAMAHRAHNEVLRYTWPAVRDEWASVYSMPAVAAPSTTPRPRIAGKLWTSQ